MNICWCTIRVSDLEKSIYFYEEILGLKQTQRFQPMPDRTIVFLKDEHSMKIELIFTKDEKHIRENQNVSIGFVTSEFEEILDRLKNAGIEIKKGPLQMGPDTICFFVDDPNGINIQIIKEDSADA